MLLIDHTVALDRIEGAHHQTPFCGCGAPTTVSADRHGRIWLQCRSLEPPKGLLGQLLSLDPRWSHTLRLILDEADLQLAA